MILGYEIETCPFCQKGTLNEVGDTIVCSGCGLQNKSFLLAKILNIASKEAVRYIVSGDYGRVEEGEGIITAKVNGIPVNSYDVNSGKFQYSYPSIFPEIPEGDIICFEKFLTKFCFFNEWSSEWTKQFKGKEVCFNSIDGKFGIHQAKLCAQEGAAVFVNGEPLNPINSKDSLEHTISTSVESMSLIEILDNLHCIQDKNGNNVYNRGSKVAPRVPVEITIDWFLKRGAKFLFNYQDDCGYMIYESKLYVCDSKNRKFLSLLWEIGRISVATNEGRNIIAGLCAMANTSEPVVLKTWIDGDTKENIIKINQGSSIIIISQNEVKVKPSEEVTFESLLGDKWFKPLELADIDINEGLNLLEDKYMKWLAVPPVAREIITCWVLSTFLKDYSSIRPGIRVSGKYSSGKSTILYLSNWLFYGTEKLGVTGKSTPAGLWRKASVEPILFLDNENVKKSLLSADLQQFLDLCATGAGRTLATKDSSLETKTQNATAFIMISGLDSFMNHDVKTRYIEIIAPVVRTPEGRDANPWKSKFIPMIDIPELLSSRNKIMSSILRVISTDVIPNLHTIKDRDIYYDCYNKLGSKHRITDYFMIMSLLGESLQRRGIFPEGNLRERWIKYITDTSTVTDLQNASTIEWWELFKICYNRHTELFAQYLAENPTKGEVILDNEDKLIGVIGTKEFLFLCMRWVNKETGSPCPWTRAVDLLDEMNSDIEAWKAKEVDGWNFIEGQKIIVKFGS